MNNNLNILLKQIKHHSFEIGLQYKMMFNFKIEDRILLSLSYILEKGVLRLVIQSENLKTWSRFVSLRLSDCGRFTSSKFICAYPSFFTT